MTTVTFDLDPEEKEMVKETKNNFEFAIDFLEKEIELIKSLDKILDKYDNPLINGMYLGAYKSLVHGHLQCAVQEKIIDSNKFDSEYHDVIERLKKKIDERDELITVMRFDRRHDMERIDEWLRADGIHIK